MPPRSPRGPVATLIGDLVGSREAPQRRALQRKLAETLDWTTSVMQPRWPLEPTIGDEFQGVFESISEAARASLLVRLHLLAEAGVDSRYGLGLGRISVFD